MASKPDTTLSKLDPREQQFIHDVIKDMLFDSHGIKIPMKGQKRILGIAESMAICIFESKGQNAKPYTPPPINDWAEAPVRDNGKWKEPVDDDDDWPD